MNFRTFSLPLLLGLIASTANAYPPAPDYRIYGSVRNERGDPLASREGSVILSGFQYSAFGSASVGGGAITGVAINNGGSGFTSAPTVTFSGGPGTGATGTAVLTNGVVTGVTVTNPGSGYTEPVIVGIAGGGGLPLEIVRSLTDSSIAPGVNYSLSVPMDSGTAAQLYEVSAMRPLLPFTIRVVIRGVNHVPIQIKAPESAAGMAFWRPRIDSVNSPGISSQGNRWAIGLPAGKLRLDLWLGVDSNNDGLPDEWQQQVVNADTTGRLTDFSQVDPNADFSGNGMTNMDKFLTGVYALEPLDGLHFNLDAITDLSVPTSGNPPVPVRVAKLHFQAITGRTYHISTTSDMQNWTNPQPFSLKTDGTEPATHYLADESKILNIYVPLPAGTAKQFFRLYAQ